MKGNGLLIRCNFLRRIKFNVNQSWVSTFSVSIMQFPPELRTEIQSHIDQAKELYPASLSEDGKALLVDGSIGYGCYVSADGDIFMETYELGTDEPSVFDRSRKAQIAVLVLGSRTLPKLAEMLPKRPSDALDCTTCNGIGWLHQELFRERFDSNGILCPDCSGLGWVEVA